MRIQRTLRVMENRANIKLIDKMVAENINNKEIKSYLLKFRKRLL